VIILTGRHNFADGHRAGLDDVMSGSSWGGGGGERCLVIEDSCEALGSELQGVKSGALTKADSFSCYYGHHISTIEGGAVTTSDENLYTLMLSIRSHGWTRDLPSEVRAA